jgi:hypothetical protein
MISPRVDPEGAMKVEAHGRKVPAPVTKPALPSAARLAEWHDATVLAWHRDPSRTADELERRGWGEGPVEAGLAMAIGREHLTNIQLWHEVDEARRPDVGDHVIAGVKRRIDALNQRRNDLIEAVDDALTALLQEMGVVATADSRLHSETPGAIIDRLSILALKVYHMREEAVREDVDLGHRSRCSERLEVLESQRADLAGCLDALLGELASGRARFRTYRQFKMYNDPETNPAVRASRRAGGVEGGLS